MPPEYHQYALTLRERQEEYADVSTFSFAAEEPIPFHAGQYGHLRVPNVPEGEKAVREFSFANAPGDPDLLFTVNTRSGSGYQHALMAMRPGDVATLFKIKGALSLPEEGETVMVAQGVGMAPFRSLIRSRAPSYPASAISLIHVGRGDFLYDRELSTLPYVRIKTTREDLPHALVEAARAHAAARFLVAGAPAFVDGVTESLLREGVPIGAIIADRFKGLEE